MLKLLKVALCSALFVVGSNASDFLAKATGGVLSNNHMGIKQLNPADMNEIKGGYLVQGIRISSNEYGVAAIPHWDHELGLVFDSNGYLDNEKSAERQRGLCAMGVTECYYNKETKTHLYQSVTRLQEFIKGLGGTYDPKTHAVTYTVRRDIKVTDRGTRYVLFTYGVGAYNYYNKTFHKIDSSLILNNNMIIKELRDAYKESLENHLGGWTAR